jgi:hypothetical protein
VKRRLTTSLVRFTRWILGLAAFGLAGYWFLEGRRRRRRPLYGVEADTGRPTGLRISPLAPLEAAIARELERDLSDRRASET